MDLRIVLHAPCSLQEIERIAKVALRELGAGDPPLTITADSQADRWRLTSAAATR